MKRTALASLVIAAACLMATAHAADLTIRFTGSFARGTCQFSVPSVDLGTHYATDFDTQPQPWTSVTVTRSGCTSDISMIHMAVLGTPHPLNNDVWQVPGIAGLAVEMRTDTGTVVWPNRVTLGWLPANSTYMLYARFNKVATISTYGRVSTPVTLSFTYN